MLEQGRPDWVVLGAPAPDGQVQVYASRDLTDAELRHEVEDWGWRDSWRMVPPRTRIELAVGMRTAVRVIADTYEEAFRVLFDTWSPTADTEPAAIDGRRQITPEVEDAG